MDRSAVSTRMLKTSVSAAALAGVAWGLPGAAHAQSCTLDANLQNLNQGTVVACPQGTQLDFPGAVPLGFFTIPNDSGLTSVLDGYNPDHQLWQYTSPSGVISQVFLQGHYDLSNALGGSTPATGRNIAVVLGAGPCATGAQFCPGFYSGESQYNVASPTDAGIYSNFETGEPYDTYGTQGSGTYEQDGSPTFVSDSICDAMPSGNSCGGTGAGFDFSQLDGELAQCESTGESCAIFVTPNQGVGIIHYSPQFDDTADAAQVDSDSSYTARFSVFQTGGEITGNGFNDDYRPTVYTDPDGRIIVTLPAGTTDFTPRLDSLIENHDLNSKALQQMANYQGGAGGGVQSTFSLPDVSTGGFLLTSIPGQPGLVLSAPVELLDGKRYDFGNGTSVYVDDTTLPNIVSVTPGLNSGGGSDLKTSFVLKFSEPMDTATVEDNFEVRSFLSHPLVVDPGDFGDTGGEPPGNANVWDDSAFDVTWNSDDTEATVTIPRLSAVSDGQGGQDFIVTYGQPGEGNGSEADRRRFDFSTPESSDDALAGSDRPGATTAGALALIFSIDTPVTTAPQIVQLNDVLTTKVPPRDLYSGGYETGIDSDAKVKLFPTVPE